MKRLVALLVFAAVPALPAAAQSTDEAQSTTAPPPTITQTGTPTPEVKKDAAPPHAHTGWATLAKDTVHDFIAFPKRKSTYTLLGIGGAAALATHPADKYVSTHITGNDTANKAFKLGQWVGQSGTQIGVGVGLWAVGRYVVAPSADESRTNKYSELGFDLIRAQILSEALVHAIKPAVGRDRPNGECCAFPSGHASSAFAAAAVLERHLGYRGSWPALAAATYVGASRLVDNRHWLSDVAFGAGLGTAVGWTVVGTHGRGHQYALQPVPIKGGMMFTLTRLDEAGSE